jgi:predicted unusual protein kinase regulating ubiquinone biosynthesis (AarF/ABC1/UbiB family)
MLLVAMRAVLPLAAPAVWRGCVAWQRSIPIIVGFVRASKRAKQLTSKGHDAAAQQVWDTQHRLASEQLYQLLVTVGGFYMKLGQILATKSDMLPPVYTDSLSRLLDELPPAPFKSVVKTLQRELLLGRSLHEVFSEFECEPLACATIAQVTCRSASCT